MDTPQGKVPELLHVSNQSVPRDTPERASRQPGGGERGPPARHLGPGLHQPGGVDLSACPRLHFLPARTLSDRIYPRASIGLTGQQWQLSIQHCQLLIPEAGGEYLRKECRHQPVSRVKPFCIRQKCLQWQTSA